MSAHSSVSSCVLARHISRRRTVAQVMSLSSHPHVHLHVSVSPRFALLFYFTHFLPHSFHFLLHLKFVDNLRIPPKESMDLSDEFLISTGYMSPTPTTSRRPQSSPTRSSWTRRRSSPTKSLLRTPTTVTLHSRVCFAKLTEYIATTLHEKTCLSVCRRQCPTDRRDPLETERGDPLSKETRKHRLGLCSTNKKSKFLQSAKQELTDTNFKPLTTEEVN